MIVFSCYYVFSGVYLHPSPVHMDVPCLIIIFIALFASLKCFSQSVLAFMGLYSHAQTDCGVFGLNCNLKEKRAENENMLKKKKKPPHNCGSPAVHNLGCSRRTKPRKRSFPLGVKNVLVLAVLGLISSPLHHVKTESGLSDLPVDNTKMVFSPAFNAAMIAGKKKKKNPS